MGAHAEKPPTPKPFASHTRIVESLGIPAAVLDLDGTLIHANERLAMLLEAPRQAVVGTRLERWVVPEDRRRYRRLLRTTSLVTMVITDLGLMQQGGGTAHVQLQFGPRRIRSEEAILLTVFDVTAYRAREKTLEGERAELEASVTALNQELLLSVVRQHEEIEQRERAERRLTAALADTEALLREVHHRVKNTLQVLCDLLYLQMEGLAEEKATVLRDTYRRIYAMAQLHGHLYVSLESGQVKLGEYIAGLVSSFETLAAGGRIGLEVRTSEGLTIDLDRAVHVGLIVNELVINTLKHAFPKGEHGEVTVRVHRMNDVVHLQVRDNGKGLPADFDLAQTKSLGLRIVHILARRLQATVDAENDHGATVTLTFPLHADAPAGPRPE